MPKSNKPTEITPSMVAADLLLADDYITVPIPLANLLGLPKAVLLKAIHKWCESNKKLGKDQFCQRDRWWTCGTYQEWSVRLPFLGGDQTVKRLLLSLQKDELLISDNFNRLGTDRTRWYSVDLSKLGDLYLKKQEAETLDIPIGSKMTNGTGQNQPIEQVKSDRSLLIYNDVNRNDMNERDLDINSFKHREAHSRDRGREESESEILKSREVDLDLDLDLDPSLRCQGITKSLEQNGKATHEMKDSAAPRAKVKSERVQAKPREIAIKNKVNSLGWLQMDRRKCFKLARAIATRRTALALIAPYVKFGADGDGDLTMLLNGEWRKADREFKTNYELEFAALRNYSLKHGELSQNEFNALLEAIFEATVEWLSTQGDVSDISTLQIHNLFLSTDRILLEEVARSRRVG